MSLRFILAAVAAATLAACAVSETRELTGSRWQTGPDAEWVVENWLATRAESDCAGGYDVLSKSESRDGAAYVTRWTIDCRDPRP